MHNVPTCDLRAHTFLLVDEDRQLCAELTHQLRMRGAGVVVAHSIADAIAEAQAWNPSRAVIGLRLMDGNGLQLIPQLHAIQAAMRVVVLTGFGSIASAVEAMKLGATHYLTKPVELDGLLYAFDRVAPNLHAPPPPLETSPVEIVEWEHLQRTLTDCNGNVSEAARRLGMHRRSLQRKLARGRPETAAPPAPPPHPPMRPI